MAVPFSQINGGIAVAYNPVTDTPIVVRTVAGVPTDQLVTLPPITSSANMAATGAAPTLVLGTGAGTGATATFGNDNSGVLSITVGTTPAANAAVATLTFNQGFVHGSSPILTPADATTAAVMAHCYASGSTASWTLSTTTALTANTTYNFNYAVIGR